MAVSSISRSVAALNAYESQGQSGDTQNPLASPRRSESAAQARLSVFGRVQSSLADLQARAQALKHFSKPPTFDEFKTAVQGFVQSFNALNKTVNDVSNLRQGLLNGDLRPGQVLSEVRKALAGMGESSLAMQKQGVERQKDGTLALNQKTLDKAFQADRQGVLNTFAEVSDRVGKAIDQQLSSNGLIGRKAQDLSPRAKEPEADRDAVQTRLENQKSFQQHLATQLAQAGGYVARNAVVTYFSVASM